MRKNNILVNCFYILILVVAISASTRAYAQIYEPAGTWQLTAINNVNIQCSPSTPVTTQDLIDYGFSDPIGRKYDVIETQAGLYIVDRVDLIPGYIKLRQTMPNRYTLQLSDSTVVNGISIRRALTTQITLTSDEDAVIRNTASLTIPGVLSCRGTYSSSLRRTAHSSLILRGLSLSTGTLHPSFKANTTQYIATVDHDVKQIILNLTTNRDSHKITVNGRSVSRSIVIPINKDSSTINIKIQTPYSDATGAYAIEVIRLPEQEIDPVGTWESTAIEDVDIQCPILPDLGTDDLLEPVGSKYDVIKTSGGLFNIIAQSDSRTYRETSRQRPNRYTFQYSYSETIEDIRITETQTVDVILVSDNEAKAVASTVITAPELENLPECYATAITKMARQLPHLTALDLSYSSGSRRNILLSPNFDSTKTEYTVNTPIASYIKQVSIAATANDNTHIISVNGRRITRDITVPLNVGSNTIAVVVSTSDNRRRERYTVRLTRASPYLSSLNLSSGTLNPVFNRATRQYATTVGSGVGQVRLTAIADDALAQSPDGSPHTITATINGTPVDLAGLIPLNIGGNTIVITVTTADNKATISYTIRITREAPYLSRLNLSSGILNPAFNRATKQYATSVGSGVGQVRLTTIADDSSHTITATINGTPVNPAGFIPLNVGGNTIVITVTTADNKAPTLYTVKATRLSPCLTSLSLSSGIISPNFIRQGHRCGDAAIPYKAIVANDVSQINVTAIADSNLHRVTFNSTQSAAVSLNVGDNEIAIRVTTADGKAMEDYNLIVRRLSTAILTDITVETTAQTVTLKPSFSSTALSYTAILQDDVTSITVIPTAPDGRTINIRYTPEGSAAIDQPVLSDERISITPLPDFVNIIYIDVTHNGATEQYILRIQFGILVRAKVFLEGPL